MVHEITAFEHFMRTHGVLAAGLLMAGAVGLVFLTHWFWKTGKRMTEAVAKVDLIAQALTDNEGAPVSHHEHLQMIRDTIIEVRSALQVQTQAAFKHYEDVERLTDEEHWKNCPVDKCPNFPRLLGQYGELVGKFEGLASRLEMFEVNSSEMRNRNNEILDNLAKELSSLGREVIATLRVAQKIRNSKGEESTNGS
jgi:hypothetical protein